MQNNLLDTINAFISYCNELLPFDIVQISIALLIFSFFMLLRKVFTRYIFDLIYKIYSKRGTEPDKNILQAFEAPLRLFFIVLGIYAALMYLPLSAGQKLLFVKIFRSLVIILVAAGFYNLLDVNSVLMNRIQKKFDIELDKTLTSLLAKSARLLVIIITFTIVAQEWNYDINGLIAGMGLGGLAVALAAKDALANIFGGIVIIMDKPFKIGDWISTSSIEGTVEDMTLRSTKIRTFAHSVVTVPNSTLANEAITNWSRMGKRRINFNLVVKYDTPRDKLEKCLSRITHLLHNHPDIHKETIFSRLNSFGENGLEIFLYFFTITTIWGEYLKVREDIHLKIMEILEEEGVSIALPSKSIYIENRPTDPGPVGS